jgi:hypothetical protein
MKKYGDKGTMAAVDKEIFDNIKSFYRDLINGNCQQNKYEPYLRGDIRLLQLAIQDSEVRMTREWIILSSLQFSSANGLQACANSQFNSTIQMVQSKYRAYGLINNGLSKFLQTGNMQYLVMISVQMQDPMNRQFRPEL